MKHPPKPRKKTAQPQQDEASSDEDDSGIRSESSPDGRIQASRPTAIKRAKKAAEKKPVKEKAKADQRIDTMLSTVKSKHSNKVKINRLPARKASSPVQKYLIGKNTKGALFAALDSESTIDQDGDDLQLPVTPPTQRKASPIDLDTPSLPPASPRCLPKAGFIDLDTPSVPPASPRGAHKTKLSREEDEEEIDELASDAEEPALPILDSLPAAELAPKSHVADMPVDFGEEAEEPKVAANDFLAWLDANVRIDG
jgi:hypothetical protein